MIRTIMKSVAVLVILIILSACAAKSPSPARPVLNTSEGANCLRECDAIYTLCLASTAHSRTPLASTTAGILIGAIADSTAANDASQSCNDRLNPCYLDCGRFNQ